MEKIIIADDIRTLIEKKESFLNRSTIRIFTVTSNEEALNIHTAEKINLIITKLDMPEMSSEMFCSVIRKDEELRKVSIIIICANNKSDIERSSRCRANSIITMPINIEILLEKAQQLLNIAKRECYRVLSSVKVNGKYRNKPFFCHLENISASGILLKTDKILAEGDIVKCSFFLPDSIHIITDGEIVRVVRKTTEFDTNQYGIKFSNLPLDSRAAIEAFDRKKIS